MDFANGLEVYLKSSPYLAYLITFAAGVLASFTPCVYPLIPILVGYIGGRAENSKWKAFIYSIVYVLGMAIVYAVLGIIAVLAGKMFGEISSSPIAYLVIANIIILFGLSMLGVFTIQVPSFFQGLRMGKDKVGLLGPFLLGVSSGFIAAPCTTAVVGVILTYAAASQNFIFGATLLFVFALGTGVLLIVAGTFTGFLLALPKSGMWTNVIQKIFGWFMIALGEYFLIKAGMLFI